MTTKSDENFEKNSISTENREWENNMITKLDENLQRHSDSKGSLIFTQYIQSFSKRLFGLRLGSCAPIQHQPTPDPTNLQNPSNLSLSRDIVQGKISRNMTKPEKSEYIYYQDINKRKDVPKVDIKAMDPRRPFFFFRIGQCVFGNLFSSIMKRHTTCVSASRKVPVFCRRCCTMVDMTSHGC